MSILEGLIQAKPPLETLLLMLRLTYVFLSLF